MRSLGVFVLVMVASAACQRPRNAPPGEVFDLRAGVFNDSAVHARQCLPLERGQDWRKWCTPRDQRVDFAFPLSPLPKP